MEYTKEIDRLKLENKKPEKRVEVLKKELAAFRKKLKKKWQSNEWLVPLNGLTRRMYGFIIAMTPTKISSTIRQQSLGTTHRRSGRTWEKAKL